jgi:prepilin-type N-terminal cleavage/methylation domain-containing protein/prepilin-type processing-associated H-X9-DG protein
MRRQRRAFTLVELLVVIGIIALLISILLPALSRARAESVKLKCLAQLKEIGSLALQYANENGGRVPKDYNYDDQYRGLGAGSNKSHLPHILWAEAFAHLLDKQDWPLPLTDSSARDPILAPYLRKIPLFSCPAKPVADQPITYGAASWDINSDDGIANPTYAGEGMPMIKLTAQRYAAQICYITEINSQLGFTAAGCFDAYDIKDKTCIPYDPPNVKNGAWTTTSRDTVRMMNDSRHNGFINMLYLDGHAATKRIVDTSRYDFRWIPNGQNGS